MSSLVRIRRDVLIKQLRGRRRWRWKMLRRLFLPGEHVDQGRDFIGLKSVAEGRHTLPSVTDLLFDRILLQALANRKQRGPFAWDADAVGSVAVFASLLMKEHRPGGSGDGGRGLASGRNRSRNRSLCGVNRRKRRLHRQPCKDCERTTKDKG
jgi:hypothetical protein